MRLDLLINKKNVKNKSIKNTSLKISLKNDNVKNNFQIRKTPKIKTLNTRPNQ